MPAQILTTIVKQDLIFTVKLLKTKGNSNSNLSVKIFVNTDPTPYVGTVLHDKTPAPEIIAWSENQVKHYLTTKLF